MYSCSLKLGHCQRSFVRSRTALSRSRSSSLCPRRSYSHRRITKQPALNVATVAKEMPKSKGPAFFQNNLADGRDHVQSESTLIEPLSHATYDALQASDCCPIPQVHASPPEELKCLQLNSQAELVANLPCLLQQVIERGMHSGEGIQGCSIYTGTGGVAYMFLRLAEGLRHSQSLIAQHPKQPLAKLTPECLLKRAEEYGHWANHLSHRHTKVHIVVF